MGSVLRKILFVHDHVFSVAHDGIYSSGAFPSWAWGRYLNEFSSVTVAARSKKSLGILAHFVLIEVSGMELSLSSLRAFQPCEIFFTGGGDTGRKLKELVARHDAVVVRLSSELGLLALKHAVTLKRKLQ